MKNCRQCGAQIDENDEYCPRCGIKNNSDDAQSQSVDLNKSAEEQKEKVILNKAENYGTDPEEKDVVILDKSEYTESKDSGEEQVSETQQNTENNTVYTQPVYTNDSKEYDALCLIGFILTFFGGTILSLILCIIGIINFDEERKKGKGFGIAGIIINSIIIILPIILIFIILILAALGITISNSFDGFIY